MMSSNIYITKEDFESARNYLVQFLRDSGYEGSLEDGTALHDLVIKAFALLFGLYKRQTDKVKGYISLNAAIEMQDVLGDDYDLAVDSIMSNWFVQRKDGTKTNGVVRLWFSKPLDFLQVSPGSSVILSEGAKYEATSEQIFVEDDFSGLVNTVNKMTEYYVDVNVQSMTNTSTQPLSTSSVTGYVNSIYFIRATILADFAAGTEKESTNDFITRTEKVITTRELITERAITTVLTDNFPTVNSVYVAGHGDKEQLRDIVQFDGIAVHVGNKADIYVSGTYVHASGKLTVGLDGNVDLQYLGDGVVVNHIEKVYLLTEDDKTEIDYTVVSCDEGRYGSGGCPMVLNFPEARNMDIVEIVYVTCVEPKYVSDFVRSENNRVACYDPIVKSKHVVHMQFSYDTKRRASVSEDKFKADMKTYTLMYVQQLAKANEVYRESDLLAYLHANIPALYNVELPLAVQYKVFDPKSLVYKTGTLPDFASYDVFGVTSNQFTDNTLRLYTNEDLITVNINKVVS